MALKRHEIFRDEHTIGVASHTLSAVIHESLVDLGYDCLVSSVLFNEDGENSILYYRCMRAKPSRVDIDEVERFVERYYGVHLEIREDESHPMLLDNHEHLRLARGIFRLVTNKLKPLLSSNVEHLLLLWWNGNAVIMPGSERNVVFPSKRYTATAHTHPSGLCIPSPHDLDSFRDILAEGGCCTVILSPTCMFMLGRRDALSLEDYDALSQLARIINKTSLEEALRMLSELSMRSMTLIVELRSL